jgi:ADP-ribose pyrophosphatase YjhB (NUDIX family)
MHLGVKGIVLDAGRVLLVRTTYGDQMWDFPGGHVRRGESAEDAVIREVREETGVVVSAPALVGVDYVTKYKHDHVLLFTCRVAAVGTPPRSPEIAESGFFALDGLPPTRSGTRRWLELPRDG